MLFLSDLAYRVDQLEKNIPAVQAKEVADFSSILADPDFSATLKEDVISASHTSERAKQKLLGSLVTDRLQAKPEGIWALTASSTISAIPHVSRHQLNLLGLAVLIKGVRPPAADLPDSNTDKVAHFMGSCRLIGSEGKKQTGRSRILSSIPSLRKASV